MTNGGTLKTSGALTLIAGRSTFIAGSGTVDYNGAAQTVTATTYNNLSLSGSGAKTMTGVSTINGNFTLSGTASTTSVTVAMTIGGNLTIGTGTTFAAGTSLTHNVGGNWTNNGTFSFTTTSTINFNGNNALQTISGSTSTAFNAITLNKGSLLSNTLEATGPMSMTGQTTITNGTFKLTHASASGQFNGASNITLPATAGLWINGGSWTSTGISLITTSGSLVRCSAGTLTLANGSGNRLEVVAGATLTMEGGTLNIGGRLFNNGGSAAFSGGTANLATVGLSTSGNAVFEMTAASNVTITSGNPLIVFQTANANNTTGDLLVVSGGTKNITSGTFQFGNASTPAGQIFLVNSNVSLSSLSVNGTNSPTARLRTNALTLSGSVAIASGGTLDAATNNLNMTVGGNWSNSGTYSGGSSTATVTFNGSGNTQTLSGTSTFNNLTVNHSGAGSVTASGSTLTVSALLRVQAGTFTSSSTFKDVQIDSTGTLVSDGGTMNVSGNWTNNGGTFTPATGTVNFNSTTASQSINGTSTSHTFNVITVNKTGQTLSISGSATLLTTGTLTVTAGTFDQGVTSDLSADTTSIASGATLKNLGAGDLTVGSGGVTNNGTITFDGSGGGCGTADSILIRSSVNGTQRSWSGTGTFSMNDVDVKDQAGTAIITVFSGTNTGNNGSNWVFINGCSGAGGNTYVWVGPTLGNDSWVLPANWKVANSNPNTPRAATAATDVLIFDGSSTPSPTVSAIPTQTIAALKVINDAFPSFSTSAANTLTIDAGSGGLGFDVKNLGITGSNALTIKLGSGTLGNVSGTMTVDGGGHRLISNDASGITFPSTGIFTTSTGFTGNAFGDGSAGNGAAGSVVFQSGAKYFHNAGSSPFGASGNASVVTFQTGSFATYLTATGFDANGRTYATLEIGKGDPSGVAVNASDSGTGNFQFDNLVINNTGSANSSLTFTGSGTNTITIRGNITSVAAGSGGTLPDVTFTAGSGGIVIDAGGLVTFGAFNSRTIEFESNTTVVSGTTLALARKLLLGIIQPNSLVLTVDGGLTGSSSGYLIGNEKRSFAAPENFTYHVGTVNGYSPLDANVTVATGNLTAAAIQGAEPVLTSSSSLQRYWILTEGGTIKADLTMHYLDPTDIMGTEADYQVIVVEGGNATRFPPDADHTVDTTNNKATILGVENFSHWTLGAPQAPTAVKLTGFTATRNGDEVMLQWRTGYEARNLGYNIYREENGKRVAITPSLVAGSALLAGRQTRLTSGLTYTWYDQLGERSAVSNQRSAVSNQRSAVGSQRTGVTYWLEDVDLNGTRTLHGPIATTAVETLPRAGKWARADLLSEVGRRGSGRTAASGVQITGGPAGSGPVGSGPAGSGLTESGSSASGAALRPQSVTPMERDRGAELTSDSSDSIDMQRQIAGLPGVKIAISRPGWYRITQPELLAAGLDANIDATHLQLYASGEPVAIKQTSAGETFDASDYLEFYGEGLESATDKGQTYYLVVGDEAGSRIQDVGYTNPRGLRAPPGVTSFAYTVERKERMIYFSGLLNGDTENFFGQIVTTTPAQATLPVRHLNQGAGAAGAQLEVALQGVTSQSHLVQVRLNGTDLGTLDFANTEHAVKTLAVAGGALLEGTNTVELTALGGAADVNLVDTLRLTYAHTNVADDDQLTLNVYNTNPRRVDGFTTSNVRVVDLSDVQGPTELTPALTVRQNADQSYSVTVQVPGVARNEPHRLLFFTDERAQAADALKHNEPSAWWAETEGADYLIVTTRELMASVEPLAELRRQQGMVVKVIDVEDLYDEFSYGQHTPQAIHELLQTALSNWTLKPHYVLLAGDASYDPKNYFGQGLNDLVPTKLLDTSLMEAASDDWLADFNGDGVADLALGRLPARTAADTNTMVGKIVSYETAAPAANRGALLVADTSFESSSSAVGSLLPAGMAIQTINRGATDDATVHTQIIAGLNQGPQVANYFGHGSNGVWTGASLLSSDDAPGLTNTNRLSVFTMMTCFNGFFQDAWNDSLSEALLKSPGGAVAVWASTTLTDPSGQNVIDQEFYRQLFAAQPATLGDASRAAKITTGDADVRRTWTLFGDPAMRLR